VSGGPDERQLAAARIDQLLDARRYPAALELLGTALAQQPDDPDLLCQLSRAHFGLNQWQPALTAARAALVGGGHQPEPWIHASYALQQLLREDEAIRHARHAVEIGWDAWQTHVALAMVAARVPAAAGMARAAALKAVELAPDEPYTHFCVGWTAEQVKDRATAERAYRQVLALEPDHTMAHNQLGELYQERGEYAAAAERFLASAASDPRSGSGRDNLDGLVRVWWWRSASLVNLIMLVPLFYTYANPWLCGWCASLSLVVHASWAALRTSRLTPRIRRVLRSYPRRHRTRTALVAVALAVLLVTAVLGLLGVRWAVVANEVYVLGTVAFWLGELLVWLIRGARAVRLRRSSSTKP
jgi:tetratricopeptide (TPR) repeat protein